MAISFVYRNHRNVVAERTVFPLALHYHAMPRADFNHSPGWFLHCQDFTNGRQGEIRSFELNSIMMPEDGFAGMPVYHGPAYIIPFPLGEVLNKKVADLERQIAILESQRPHWAMGYTDDGIAAQVSSTALSQLWELLGVDNQTAAVRKLKEMTK